MQIIFVCHSICLTIRIWWEHGCDYSSERNIWFCVVLMLFWHQSATTRVPLLIDDTDKWFLWKIMFAMANVIELLNRLNRSKQQNVKHKSKKQHLKKVRKPLKKVRSLFKKNIVTPMKCFYGILLNLSNIFSKSISIFRYNLLCRTRLPLTMLCWSDGEYRKK